MKRGKPHIDSYEDMIQDNIFISGDNYEEEQEILREMMMEYMEERKAIIKTKPNKHEKDRKRKEKLFRDKYKE